ncbi:MAG TPA: hypothetical protein PLX46_09725 [Thiobacillaceae bacterium]|nr:hypothetical protein [Thiobacillaceae bacterium]
MSDHPHLASSRPGLDVFLGVVQFLFLLSWVVYVVFLDSLLAKLGLPKEYAPRLLLVDQGLFALADVALGLQADRLLRAWGRVAPLLVVLNLLACLAFVVLPGAAGVAPELFFGLTALWVLSASALRAPLYGLIARRAEAPARRSAAALLGMGLASALAPYLGQAMKGLDPFLPFLVSGIVLALASLGFASLERGLSGGAGAQAPTPARQPLAPRWLLTALLLGLGFQIHAFINAAPLYKQFADPGQLPWLLPVFWIGFSLAVYPGSALVRRQGARRVLAVAALLGALASGACPLAPNLAFLLALQGLAGGAWGACLLAGLTVAGAAGHVGREALFVGGWFACLAVAAMLRIGLGLAGIGFDPHLTPALAAGFWLAGALPLLAWMKSLND